MIAFIRRTDAASWMNVVGSPVIRRSRTTVLDALRAQRAAEKRPRRSAFVRIGSDGHAYHTASTSSRRAASRHSGSASGRAAKSRS